MMTYPTPQQPPVKRRRHTALWVVLGVLALACGSTPTKPIAPINGVTQPAEPASRYVAPTKTDFKIAIKILKKDCFGSAGCNVQYRATLSYSGTGLDPDKTYEVTYAVRGADDPITGTFEITGGDQYSPDENYVGTPSSGAKLVATVTAVEEA